jgi:hypothetical protein
MLCSSVCVYIGDGRPTEIIIIKSMQSIPLRTHISNKDLPPFMYNIRYVR